MATEAEVAALGLLCRGFADCVDHDGDARWLPVEGVWREAERLGAARGEVGRRLRWWGLDAQRGGGAGDAERGEEERGAAHGVACPGW